MKVIKIMKKTELLLTITFIMFSFACSGSKYDPRYSNYNNYSTYDAENRVETIEEDVDFDVYYTSEGSDMGSNSYQKRAIADFFFYNKSNITNKDAPYGFTSTSDWLDYQNNLDSDTYLYGDIEANYWHWNDLRDAKNLNSSYSGILHGLAPRNIGNVSHYKLTFAFNIDDDREVITNYNSMLEIEIQADETFYAKFYGSQSSLSVSKGTLYDTLKVRYADNCGHIDFTAHLYRNVDNYGSYITDVSITYQNSVSSYTNSACYFDGSLPSGTNTNNLSIPAVSKMKYVSDKLIDLTGHKIYEE